MRILISSFRKRISECKNLSFTREILYFPCQIMRESGQARPRSPGIPALQDEHDGFPVETGAVNHGTGAVGHERAGRSREPVDPHHQSSLSHEHPRHAHDVPGG
jgi:hypothetical protein